MKGGKSVCLRRKRHFPMLSRRMCYRIFLDRAEIITGNPTVATESRPVVVMKTEIPSAAMVDYVQGLRAKRKQCSQPLGI